MKNESLEIKKIPNLHQPTMICGISGWVDGGQAATRSVSYLIEKLGAQPFASMHGDYFRVSQLPGEDTLRPIIKIEEGVLKTHHWPRNRFFFAKLPDAPGDLVLFRGAEPNIAWESYAGTILDVAKMCHVQRIYVLGGVLDRTPHTKEPVVSCVALDPDIVSDLGTFDIHTANYTGPGSFPTMLLNESRNHPLSVVVLHTRVTFYPEFNVLIPHNPKSVRALIRRLNSILGLGLDLSDLDRNANELEAKLDQVLNHDPKFKEYMQKLENDADAETESSSLDISAEDAIRFAEEHIRKHHQN